MRTIFVIGIGAGDPAHLTLQAVEAMGRVEVFFVIDKGTAPELLDLRAQLLSWHASPDHRVVTISDAERDRRPDDYGHEVRRWHADRAERIGAAIDAELSDDGIGALLVWGDPSIYDSTLRVLDQILAEGRLAFDVVVVPGVSSIQALAAAHRIPLHGIGEPVLMTTGRRLAADFGPDIANAVVLLDGQLAFTEIDPSGVDIWWGAYLGTPDQLLVAGDLDDVAEAIVAERSAARERHGWLMDIYLLHRRAPDGVATGT